MQSKKRENNFVLGFFFMSVLAAISLFMTWGTLSGATTRFNHGHVPSMQSPGLDIQFFSTSDVSITIDAFSGSITVFNVQLPTWIIPFLCLAAAMMGALRVKNIVTLSRFWPLLVVLPAIVLSVFLIYALTSYGSLHLGGIIGSVCSLVIAALLVVMPAPSSEEKLLYENRDFDSTY